jgi:hypothetical protein
MTGKSIPRLLPWVLLGVAAVAGSSGVLERGTQAPHEIGRVSVDAAPERQADARGSGAQPMTPPEQRDFHVQIAHEQCEEGMKRLNMLEGRPAADPQALTQLSVCLRIGNLAWYKCVLRADGVDEAHACNRRLLSLDNPP